MITQENLHSIENLIKTYSIKEVVGLFNEIDVKINSLQTCSANDFLLFSENIRNYHQISLKIANNADVIVNFISWQYDDQVLSILKSYSNSFANTQANIHTFLQNVSEIQASLLKQLEMLYVPLKNLKQNLMTLKYLEANAKLRINQIHQSEKNNFQEKFIEELIAEIRKLFPAIESNLSKTKIFLQQNYTGIKELQELNLVSLNLQHEQLTDILEDTETKYKQIEIFKPKIAKNSSNYFESLSQIITKLQYHDIIKQKMEHIQQTHRDIVSELNLLEAEKDDSVTVHRLAKCFLKIRDIAGLQVAQLLHTNNEYETAIEQITTKLFGISSDLSTIAGTCRQIVGKFYHDDNQKSNSHYLSARFKQLSIEIQIFAQHFETNTNSLTLLFDNITTITNHVQQLKKIEHSLGIFQQTLSEIIPENLQPEYTNIFEKFNYLIEHINLIMNRVDEIMVEINSKFATLKELCIQINTENTIPKNLQNLTIEIQKIQDKIQYPNVNINSLLQESDKMTKNVTNDIKNSVKKIHYYDYFEKIIEEIIWELNTINSKLMLGNEDIVSKIENLNQAQKHYTVKSEYEILNQQINNEKIKHEDIEKSDEDNVEFF